MNVWTQGMKKSFFFLSYFSSVAKMKFLVLSHLYKASD